MRKEWFAGFIDENKGNFTGDNILDFHSGNHSRDDSINVIMQREGGLKTVSITQVTTKESQLKMSYFDLLEDLKTILIL